MTNPQSEVPCAECGKAMPERRLVEAGFDYCIACGERSPRHLTLVLSTSGFKNNCAELVTQERFTEYQRDNHVRG
jgi:hypothetical protein